MLIIEVADIENYDEANNRFITLEGGTVRLEHSLISISKWESKFEKPFIPGRSYGPPEQKTPQELYYYIKCMLIGNYPEHIVNALWFHHQKEIQEYIDSSQTGTLVHHHDEKSNNKRSSAVSSEVIYGWMVAFGIQKEYETWHINRLLTLIEVCNEQQNPSKKRKKKDVLRDQRELNKQRLAEMRKG